MEGLFPLSRELEFDVIPTAGWTEPMSDFRAAYLDAYSRDPDRVEGWAEYRAAAEASAEALAAGASDDPRWIHTDAYDEAYDIRMRTYARLFDADLGPGGWRRSTPRTGRTSKAGWTVTGGRGSVSSSPMGRDTRGRSSANSGSATTSCCWDVGPFLDRIAAAR